LKDIVYSFFETLWFSVSFCSALSIWLHMFSDQHFNSKCQTPSKTQTNILTDNETNGQTPGIEFGAF